MKKSTQTRQQAAVNAAIGSMKLEGLRPSKTKVASLRAYAEGRVTIRQTRSISIQKLSTKK